MKVRIFALLAILSLCVAGTATAGSKKGGLALTAGGKTVAGPGRVAVGAGATVAVVDGLGKNVCATIANRSKKSAVLLQLLGEVSDSETVNVGQTVALCMDDTDTVQVTCQGQIACSVDWRVDSL